MQGAEGDAGLAGKVALISGGGAAGDGIFNGRAAAILLARAGTKIVAADRELALAEHTVDMIAAEGGLRRAVTSPMKPIARRWSKPASTASDGSIFSTTMSASAAAAAWSRKSRTHTGRSCKSMSRACSCSPNMRSLP